MLYILRSALFAETHDVIMSAFNEATNISSLATNHRLLILQIRSVG
jgi:hypothetical protein